MSIVFQLFQPEVVKKESKIRQVLVQFWLSFYLHWELNLQLYAVVSVLLGECSTV
jgi:hypothetical protein